VAHDRQEAGLRLIGGFGRLLEVEEVGDVIAVQVELPRRQVDHLEFSGFCLARLRVRLCAPPCGMPLFGCGLQRLLKPWPIQCAAALGVLRKAQECTLVDEGDGPVRTHLEYGIGIALVEQGEGLIRSGAGGILDFGGRDAGDGLQDQLVLDGVEVGVRMLAVDHTQNPVSPADGDCQFGEPAGIIGDVVDEPRGVGDADGFSCAGDPPHNPASHRDFNRLEDGLVVDAFRAEGGLLDEDVAVRVPEVNHAVHPAEFADGALGHRPKQGVGILDPHQVTRKLTQQTQRIQPQDILS